MTYGIPHTVRGWDPTDIVTTVDIPPADQVDSYTGVVRGTVPGPVILVPTVALTPVDTTPAEPEPGAWLIGEALCWRDLTQDWRTNDSSIPGDWYEWPRLWALVGGPGITPRRLVPEPAPVELPWRGQGLGGVPSRFATVDTTADAEGVRAAVGDRLTACCAEMSRSDALAMADALISAARAREVKP